MKIVLLILLLVSPLYAQENIIFFIGSNFPAAKKLDDSSNQISLGNNWGNSVNVSAGTEIRLSDRFLLFPILEFNYYTYDKYTAESYIGTTSLKSSSGDPAFNLRSNFCVKFLVNERSYFFSGISIIYERLGQIRVTYSDIITGDRSKTVNPKSKFYLSSVWGWGINLFEVGAASFNINGLLHTDFGKRIETAVNLGMKYTFL